MNELPLIRPGSSRATSENAPEMSDTESPPPKRPSGGKGKLYDSTFVERPGGLSKSIPGRVAPFPPQMELSGRPAVPLAGPVVAVVLDGGVEHMHFDLDEAMYVNLQDPKDGQDNDNDGVVDNVYGLHIGTMTGEPYKGRALDHGTHCGGIHAAEDNNEGNTGVGAGKIKVMTIGGLYENAELTTNFARAAAVLAKRKVDFGENLVTVSCSFGADYKDAPSLLRWHEAAQKLMEANVLVVCATANGNGSDMDKVPGDRPSNIDLPNVISVAAMDRMNDKLAKFSSWGKITVDVAARGEGVNSTMPKNKHGPMSGTSMATPFVAGAAASADHAFVQSAQGLADSIHAAYPQLHSVQLRHIILSTVEKDADLVGKLATEGKLSVEGALAKAKEMASKGSIDWQAIAGTGIVVAAGSVFAAEPELSPKEALRKAIEAVEATPNPPGRWLSGDSLDEAMRRAKEMGA